jgi:hypothetical protein
MTDPVIAAPAELEGLRDALLAPREIARDAEGWLTHPAFPLYDEDVRTDLFLAAFGMESDFVSMEADDSEAYDRYNDAADADCSYWIPTPPEGTGWMLIDIYDTEDGPYAMYARATPPPARPRYRDNAANAQAVLTKEAVVEAIKKEGQKTTGHLGESWELQEGDMYAAAQNILAANAQAPSTLAKGDAP